MRKLSDEEIDKIARSLDLAVDKASSALIKAGVPENLAQSSCVGAISHHMTILNIEQQETKIARAAVFALHCESEIQMLLFRLFNVAEITGLANNDEDAMKAQTVVISNLIGHAIDGCLMTMETEEEARDLINNIIKVLWNVIKVKRVNMDMEEESNAEGSSSIH